MTRKDAIKAIVCSWGMVEQEFCIGNENIKHNTELSEVLAAFGVTPEEEAAAFVD